jgi:hypothetical protein
MVMILRVLQITENFSASFARSSTRTYRGGGDDDDGGGGGGDDNNNALLWIHIIVP